MARHHLVPQFYLKNFKVSGTKASIYAYFRDKPSELRNTYSVAHANNFYDFTDKDGNINKDLEPTFSTIESDAKPIIDKILSEKTTSSLSEEERNKLGYFIATLYARNQAYRSKLKTSFDASSKTMMQLMAQNKEKFYEDARKRLGDKISDERIEAARQTFLKQEYQTSHDENELLKLALQAAHTIYPYILKKNWYLLEASGESTYVTSDNPVITHHSSRNYEKIFGSGGIANSTMSLTLSPQFCLMMDDRSIKDALQSAEPGLVEEINYLIAFYAETFLFANSSSESIDQLFKGTQPGNGSAVEVSFGGKTQIFK